MQAASLPTLEKAKGGAPIFLGEVRKIKSKDKGWASPQIADCRSKP